MDQEAFETEVKNHKLTVLLGDMKHYRHLLAEATDGSFNWFEIITFPGSLTINGDHGCYTFSRTLDMFEFFRAGVRGEKLVPNLYYWTQKLVSCERFDVYKYSPDEARRIITEVLDANEADAAVCVVDTEESKADAEMRVAACKSIRADVEDEILSEVHDERLLNDAIEDFDQQRIDDGTFTLFGDIDTHENARAFDHHYQWCVYAILWAIREYDRMKAEAKRVSEETPFVVDGAW